MVAAPALGQVTPGVRVPLSGCVGCAPTDAEECCKASTTSCFRYDSPPITVSSGTPGINFGTTVDCNNCFPNCPCCPVLIHQSIIGDCEDCSRRPAFHCVHAVNVCYTQSSTYEISPTLELTVGVTGVAEIKAILAQTIGQGTETTYCFTANCGWPALPPCEHLQTKPYVSFTAGAVAEIIHTWSASGVWKNQQDCTPACPIAGNLWSVAVCKEEVSRLTGSVYGGGSCGNGIIDVGCP